MKFIIDAYLPSSLAAYFEGNAATIINLLQEHSFIILEPNRIRAVE